MSAPDDRSPPEAPATNRRDQALPSPDGRRPLPPGYRPGVITAITVFIGFSLAFLRFWAFEAPGDWTAYSVAALVILLLPILGQIYALYRALRVEDDDEDTYRVTIRWFVCSVVGMLVAVCLAAVVLTHEGAG